jgi:protein phosphatase
MAFNVSGKSDIGITRKGNQDSFLILPGQSVYAVSDGMGGHAGGAQASAIAIDAIRRAFARKAEITRDRANAALISANGLILDEATRNNWEGMGTTFILVYLDGLMWQVANIGDSRVYVIKNGLISPLTRDHSLVAELLANGSITPNEAKTHPHRNVLTNALGAYDGPMIEWSEISAEDVDYLLLCTDGLHSMIEDNEILDITLTPELSVDEKTALLIDAANSRGGYDNITVILIEKGDG